MARASSRMRVADLFQILTQDAADLQHGLRGLLHAVPGDDHLLRYRPLQMRAPVRHQAIIGLQQRHLRFALGDDRVVLQPRCDRQRASGLHERIAGLEVVDAVGNLQLGGAVGRFGFLQGQEHILELAQDGDRQPHQPADQAPQPVARDVRAFVRRGDENHPLHVRLGGEVQQRAELGFDALQALALEVVVGQQIVPQHITGGSHQQAREHTAHAVADEHHVLGGRRAAGRVEVLERIVEGLVDLVAVQRDRGVGRVVHLPDLEMPAQLGIAHDLVGHVDPGFRAAAQAVQHEDDAAVRVPRLHQVHVRRADAFAQAEQRAQRLRGKARLGQPQAVGRGEIAGQRYLLTVQVHALGGLGRVHIEQHLGGIEHLLQIVALEAQQGGSVDRHKQSAC